jgi:hypothetical protein
VSGSQKSWPNTILLFIGIYRGDRNVYLFGKVKPASAVAAIMDKHDAEFDK